MGQPKETKYTPQVGYYKPVCGGLILLNQSGDYYVYLSIISLVVPLLLLIIFGFRSIFNYIHWAFIVILVLLNVLCLYFLFRTWLTEPGVIMKNTTDQVRQSPELTSIQRQVGGLMVSVKNSKSEYISKVLGQIPTLVNGQNVEGRTVLHIACQFNNVEMVKLLLSFNPDVEIRDRFGLCAIHYAVIGDYKDIVLLLFTSQGITDQLHQAAKRQELKREVESLIPRYDELRNVYVLNDTISDQIDSFFQPSAGTSVETPSVETPSETPLLNYICLDHDRLVTVKYCQICHNFMPPRSYHCRFCGICIRNFDHHCPWVSNCVGLRNHKYFMWFLVVNELLCVCGAVEMAVVLVYGALDLVKPNDLEWLGEYALRFWSEIVYFILCFGFMFPVMNLLIYHCQITSKNLTTHEEIALPSPETMKKHPDVNYYPYSEGCWKNIRYGMCHPYSKSLVNIQTV